MNKPKHPNGPPDGDRWAWLTQRMMVSDAWRVAGGNINTRRFLDFLLVGFMEHSGKNNGNIKAPFDDLVQIGIGRRFISNSISLAEKVGLVEARRGGMRIATSYALTWLPLPDGSPPTNQWQVFRDPNLKPWPAKKDRRDDRA